MKLYYIFLLFLPVYSYTQIDSTAQINALLPGSKYMNKTFTFGFGLGFNYSIQEIKNSNFDSYSASSNQGSNLNIYLNYRLNQNIQLRFAPGLSFNHVSWSTYINNIDSLSASGATNYHSFSNLELPLQLKISAKQKKAYLPFIIIGAAYSYDFSKKFNGFPSIVNINGYELGTPFRYTKNIYSGIIAIGSDVNFKNIKVGFQVKYQKGLNNLIRQNAAGYLPYNSFKLNNLVFMLTFEG